nr:hypothetical protein [Tanacetum cinerariifolium]
MLRDRVYSLSELGGGYLILEAHCIAGRNHTPEKVTVTDLFYLRGWIPGTREAAGCCGRCLMMAEDALVVDKGASAIPAPSQAPQPPARTMAQRLAKVEEEVHEIQGALGDFGVDAAKDFKENMLSDSDCWLKTYCCQYKLMLLDNAAELKLLEQSDVGDPQQALKDKGVIDSGCSRHMIRNMSYLSDFKEINCGYVSFGGNPKGGKISGKGKIRTRKLDFDDVYFFKELNFNLFSVSQMCDKKNSVLFTDTTCLVLSPEFKLPDENQMMLRVPRENNMYNVDLKNNNKALVTKPLNKTLYELLLGRTPNIGFMRPFGYLMTILNTFDPLDKKPQFEGEKPESEVHVSPSSSAQIKKHDDKTKREDKSKSHVESSTGYRNLSVEFEDFFDNSINEVNAADSLVAAIGKILTNNTNTLSAAGPSNAAVSPTHGKFSYVNTSQYPDDLNIPQLEEITYSDEEDGGAEADLTNLETTITVSHIPTTRVHKYHLVTQIIGDLSSATQTMSMIRVAKDQGGLSQINNDDFHTWFEDPNYPNKVYKVVKSLYGLHQAPRAWYETLANYLLENGFQRGKIDQTLFIKRQKGDILLVQIYVYDIIFGSTNKDLWKAFKKLVKDKFQMCSIDGKSISTPTDNEKPLLQDPDGEDVDMHTYISMIGSLMYLTSSRLDIIKSTTGGCQFLGCRLISWQCKKQTVMATSSIEAEYVAAASCCAQVLWIQNQLLDYGKKVIITEATIRDALRLDDAKSINCIFLTSMEVSYPHYTTMYECKEDVMERVQFFYGFSCHLPFNRAQVGDLSSHYTMYSSPALTQKVFANMRRVGKGFLKVDTPLFEGMIVAQHDDDVTDEGAASVADEGAASVAIDNVPDVVDEPSIPSPTPTTQPPPPSQDLLPPHKRVEHLEQDKIAQSLEITKLKQRVKKLERRNMLKVSKPRRLKRVGSAQRVDTSDDTVMDDTAEIEENADVQGRQAESQAQIYQIDLEHADKVLSMQDDELDPAKLKEVVEVVTTTKLMTEVVTAASATFNAVDTLITVAALTAASSAARRRKGVVIRDPEETATPSIIIHSESKYKNKCKEILVEEPKPLKKQARIEQDEAYTREKEKEDNPVMRYQALKRKPETEAQARKNMMIYLRTMARFKMDYFKGMKYDDIRPIFKKYFNSNVPFLEKTKEQLEEEESRTLKRKTKSQAEKAAKKQKLDEEVEELKRHLQIVLNDEDDVYTEATHLARKVPVVDYEIYTENNKPYYKIIRADGSPQLFLSFLSLLRNFDKEDIEVLWQLVKERFTSSKPKNFLDDFLLTTLTYVFEKPDVQAQLWKNQRTVHGLSKVKIWRLLKSCGVHIITFTSTQMILLVEKRYPLTRFTLDQMLNNVRLEVKEESEVSLELLRFVRQQQQEGFRP